METILGDAMKAFVLQAREYELLVCDFCTLQEMLVYTPEASGFRAGDRIRIAYRGTAAGGKPPQIRADQIKCVTKF